MSFEAVAGHNSEAAATMTSLGVTATAKPSMIASLRAMVRVMLRHVQLAVITAVTASDGSIFAVSASPDYTAGDNMGTILKFPNVVPTAGEPVKVLSLIMTDAAAQNIAGTLTLFSVTPVGGTYTDNVAQALAAADLPNIVANIPIVAGDWVAVGGTTTKRAEIAVDKIVIPTGAHLFGLLTTTTTPNMAATTDLIVKLKTIGV